MNENRDFDRAVDQWLDDGSDATPPEVIDAVFWPSGARLRNGTSESRGEPHP